MAKKRRRVEDGEGVEVEVVESAFASRREVTVSLTYLLCSQKKTVPSFGIPCIEVN
jgi:hypothetical protein